MIKQLIIDNTEHAGKVIVIDGNDRKKYLRTSKSIKTQQTCIC